MAFLGLLLAGCAGQASPLANQEGLPVASLQPPLVQVDPTATQTAVPHAPSAALQPSLPPTPTSTLAPSSTPYAVGPDEFPPAINPLTGLAPSNPGLLLRRPVLVKVTNYPRTVRPQWGLSIADHVLEYYIADQFTRFIGVFYGQDASRVGPVRSGRLFDAHVMRFYDGVFVFGWADDFVLQYLLQPDLENSLVVERPDNCPPLCRLGAPAAYNTLFVDTSGIASYLQNNRVRNEAPALSGLRFELAPPPSGSPGMQLSIHYSPVAYLRWMYDPALGAYLRQQDEEDALQGARRYSPLLDSLTLEQIAADNVLVLFVPHFFYRKSTSTEIIDQPLAGEGRGYAFRDGQIFPITWQAESATALPRYFLPDGRNYPFKPGNTWFEIVGQTTEFGETAAGEWEFSFRTP